MHFTSTTPVTLALPFWRYGAMYRPGGCSFLLDSALTDGRLGRRSYLGGEPAAVLTARRSATRLDSGGCAAEIRLVTRRRVTGDVCMPAEVSSWTGDPFAALRLLRDTYLPTGVDIDQRSGLHHGLVGYLGYECAHFLEDLPPRNARDTDPPDLAFMVADEVLAHDHVTGAATLTVVGRGIDAAAAQRDAAERGECLLQRLRAFERETDAGQMVFDTGSADVPRDLGQADADVVAEQDRRAYTAQVQRCRQHILDGDVFEVCLTQQWQTNGPDDPWRLYAALREINPAPFAAWLQFPSFQVLSASPERFLSLDRDGRAESRPIKGTRPRGATPAEDATLREDLATSTKDRAENVMIVDLVRNDLGKVCEIGSVEVPHMLEIESYATVFQLVSTITGQLRGDCDAIDLLRACFPGGSMTGAPKIEAMKIIDSLERGSRGVYSGAIGYLDAGGAMDLSIVIRTLVCRDGVCSFGSGGAVVAASEPDEEYEEMLTKARALVRAVMSTRNDRSGPADGRS